MKNKINKEIAIAIVVFFISFSTGVFGAISNPVEASNILNKLFEEFNFVSNWGSLGLFFFILINNSIKAFIAIFAGIFFGIVPFIFLIANGQILGLFMIILSAELGYEIVLAGILPHGIFEIPAIILAVSYGFWLSSAFYRKLKYHEEIRDKLKYAFMKYARIIFPMLLVAAIIETYITPTIINIFLN